WRRERTGAADGLDAEQRNIDIHQHVTSTFAQYTTFRNTWEDREAAESSSQVGMYRGVTNTAMNTNRRFCYWILRPDRYNASR
ncbi:MAG: hypothetical protein D6741_15735, partial [Planctomycetota bacterium]